jgi:hypothetical protein
MELIEIRWGSTDWIDVAWDKDMWRFHTTIGNSSVAERLQAYGEGLSCIELARQFVKLCRMAER